MSTQPTSYSPEIQAVLDQYKAEADLAKQQLSSVNTQLATAQQNFTNTQTSVRTTLRQVACDFTVRLAVNQTVGVTPATMKNYAQAFYDFLVADLPAKPTT